MKDFKLKLLSLFDANIPIIHIDSYDFETVDNLIGDLFSDIEIFEFHIGDRLLEFKTKKRVKHIHFRDLLESFDSKERIEDSILILKDIDCFLKDKVNLYYLKSISFKKLYREDFNLTTIIISNSLEIQKELDKFIATIKLPLPNEREINLIINNFIKSMEIENIDIKLIVKNLVGLDRVELLKVLNRNYQINGTLDIENIVIKKNKSLELIEKNELLEYIQTSKKFDQVGGVSKIKNYFVKVAKIFSNYEKALEFGVDIPKGVIIFGVDGSGKGLLVQASSTLLKLPIISFRFNRVENEKSLKEILYNITAFGESILWIKGVSKDKYLFTQFLEWMRSDRCKIFTILTNDSWTYKLRVGYFDEVFGIDLPNRREREEIFKIHLQKRGKMIKNINISKLIERSFELNGAEIEYSVKKGIEKSFVESEREVTTEDIVFEIQEIKNRKLKGG